MKKRGASSTSKKAKSESVIRFWLNGNPVAVEDEFPFVMLSDYLRKTQRLTGTKIVCAEGDCGSCMVLVANFPDFKFQSINSCIMPLPQVHGASIITIEGLSHADGSPSDLQNTFINQAASQCGFCTPGFIVALARFFEDHPCHPNNPPSEKALKNALTGNLCRCTGYFPILEAALKVDSIKLPKLAKLYLTQPIKKSMTALARKPLAFEASNQINETFKFRSPTTVSSLKAALKEKATVISGSTDWAVRANKTAEWPKSILSLSRVSELKSYRVSKNRLQLGALCTIHDLQEATRKSIPEFTRFMDLFASPPIKNRATLGGNIVNASPIGDTLPAWLALDATFILMGPNGIRKVKARAFFKGYRKTSVKPGEILAWIDVFIPAKDARFSLQKISQRKDLDISCVSSAFHARVVKGKLKDVRFALGGVAATPLALTRVEKALEGKTPNSLILDQALRNLDDSVKPRTDVRGSSEFRSFLAKQLLKRHLQDWVRELGPS